MTHIGKIILAAVLVIFVSAFLYFYPKQIDRELEGVGYQLGAEGERQVVISINGQLQRKLKGGKTFNGIIDISGENIPVPKQHQEVTVNFDSAGWGWFYYAYNDYGSPAIYNFGTLFINKDFTEVTILKHDEMNNSWTGEDGLMLTAPASDRQEALKLSAKLSKRFPVYTETFKKEFLRVKHLQ